MPMQPRTAPPRDGLTSDEVVTLLQDSPAVTVTAGLELVDLSLAVRADVSNALVGGSITRDSYANLHAVARLQITQPLDWGADLVRPYLTMTDGTVTARFHLGVYHLSTPSWPLEESPPTYEVEGYDMLLRLAQPVGDAYAVAAGDAYLTKVEAILVACGYQAYLIDQAAAAVVAPSARTWAFDDQVTWLTVVNDLLSSIGYAGVWSDWDGRLRCEPYQLPATRMPEWTYTDDAATTMLGRAGTITTDYTRTPNRWVIFRQNNIDDIAPVEGNGRYTYVNEAVGATSVEARGGLVITSVRGVDAADHASLLVLAQQIISADIDVPTVIERSTALNPLHWHFDRLQVQDTTSIPIADVQCTSWSITLPPDLADMQQTWRVIAQ